MSQAGVGARLIAEDVGLAAAIAAGGFLLLARPSLVSGGSRAIWLLGLVYFGLLAISVVPPVAAGPPRYIHPAVALAVGLAALALAIPAGGPSFPLRARPAGLALSAFAAVAEEAYFRRLLYGALLRRSVSVAVMVSALAFALVHVPFYGLAAFWVDLGAGLLLGWQRWASGGLAVPATTHVAANLLAVLR